MHRLTDNRRVNRLQHLPQELRIHLGSEDRLQCLLTLAGLSEDFQLQCECATSTSKSLPTQHLRSVDAAELQIGPPLRLRMASPPPVAPEFSTTLRA